MFKNVASQKWVVFAFDTSDGSAKTGDAANITGKISIDHAAAGAITDTNPTEIEDGYYVFDLTQGETNGNHLLILPESSTADIQVIGCPGVVFTDPPNFTALGIESDGDLTKVNTLDGHTAQTGDSYAIVNSGTYGNSALKTLIDTLDTVADAIKAVTDNLPNSGALSDLAAILEDTGTTLPATLATIAGYIDTEVAAILEDTGTTIPGLIAALNNLDAAGVRTAIGLASANLDTQIATLATLAKLKAYVQLLARKDAGIATDQSTALGEINNDEGSGAGAYANTTDAQEAIRDNQAGADAGAIADAVLDEALSGHTSAGTLGKAVADILEDTGTTLPGTLSTIAGYLDTEVAAILEDTSTTIPGLLAALNNMSSGDVQTAAAAALTAYDPPTKAEMDAGHALLATAASLATTDGKADSILEDTGTTLPGTLSTIAGYLDTEVAAILEDTGTTIPGLIAALNNISAAEVAAAVLDDADGIETGYTPRQALRIVAAIVAGLLSGGGTGTETFLGLDQSTTRAVATVDADGNRSAIAVTKGA